MHRCPVCPCLRCQQQRLLSASLTRRALKHPEQIVTSHTSSEQSVCPSQAADSLSYGQSDSEWEISDSRQSPSSHKKSYWTRMMRMRYVGRCLLLLVLISFGGLLAHVTVSDTSSGNNAGVDNTIGAGMVLGGSYQVDVLMKIQMRPIPVKEFQARLRTVRNKFDLLRLFLADRDISDESLARLLTASVASSSFDTFLHADVSHLAVTSPREDVEAKLPGLSNPDLHIQVTGADSPDPELPERERAARLTQSATRNVTRKGVNDSADSGAIKERGRKGDPKDGGSVPKGETPRRGLPKRDIPLSEQTSAPKPLPHNVGTSVASRATARDTSRNKPVNIDVKQSSKARASPLQNGVSQGISPSASKVADIKSDVRKDAPSSGSEVSHIKSDVKEDALLSSVKVSDAKHDRGFEDVQLAEVQKRAEPLYDDDDYSEEEEVDESDYLDGEVDYYNDAAHADAILEELEEAVHHMTEMESNPHVVCKDPLPQVVHIEDPKKRNRQFYPECTVIHRCRNDSGCCGQNYECAPKYEQVIFRAFLAVTVNPASHMVLPDSQIVERIALVNHTECHCREKPRLPDCTQACPGVFRMYRYGSQCVCDCRTSANERFPQCDDVKDGLDPLSHDDLVCIKSGKCGRPRCTVGQFDVSSGFCPLKNLYSIPSPQLSDRLRRQYLQRHRLRHHRPPPSVPVEGSGDF